MNGENIVPFDKYRDRSAWSEDEQRAAQLIEEAISHLEQEFNSRFEKTGRETLQIHRHTYPDAPLFLEVVYSYAVKDPDDEVFVGRRIVDMIIWIEKSTGILVDVVP